MHIPARVWRDDGVAGMTLPIHEVAAGGEADVLVAGVVARATHGVEEVEHAVLHDRTPCPWLQVLHTALVAGTDGQGLLGPVY